jgi:hypothetical protein
VAETPDKKPQGDKHPEPIQQGASRGVTVTVVSVAALAVIGAATANFLPSFERFSLPSFDRLSFLKFDSLSFPDFNRFTSPNPDRLAVQSPPRTPSAPTPDHKTVSVLIPDHKTVSIPIPDQALNATLKDIQSSQQQSAVVLASLTQSSSTQQTDLKRISRQISALAVQVDALAPLTTSSIPHSNARGRNIRTSRKTEPPLPPPVGPVSVGGAPLGPPPASVSVAHQSK